MSRSPPKKWVLRAPHRQSGRESSKDPVATKHCSPCRCEWSTLSHGTWTIMNHPSINNYDERGNSCPNRGECQKIGFETTSYSSAWSQLLGLSPFQSASPLENRDSIKFRTTKNSVRHVFMGIYALSTGGLDVEFRWRVAFQNACSNHLKYASRSG